MMICEEFEQLAADVDDEQAFAEASARHEAACPRCAERLAAEARATQALRALADVDRHREAPAHVEVMARAVWRGTAVARAGGMATPAPAAVATAWWRPAAAAAVIAVALAGVVFAMWARPAGRFGEAPSSPSSSPRSSPSSASSPSSSSSVGASVPRAPGATEPMAGAMGASERGQPSRPTELAARGSTRTPSRAVRQTAASASRTDTAAAAAARVRAENLAFVPFPYAEPLRPTEVRQIVRVAVPQATLLMAGLTTSTAADSVVADVLVGEDGIARGIRIVR
jgi:hypothetical protein